MTEPAPLPPISSATFRPFAEKAGVCILVHDRERILYANPATCEMLGLERHEIEGSSPDRFVAPADRELVGGRRERRLAGEAVPSSYQFKVLRGDGTERWVHFSSVLVEWDGRRAGLVTCLDVTGGKLVEQALRQRLRLDRLLADVARHFVHLPPERFEEGLGQAVARMGNALEVARAHLFLVEEDGRARCVAFWAAPEVDRRPLGGGGFSLTAFPWAAKRLDQRQTILYSRLDQLPPEAAAERAAFGASGTVSGASVPIHNGRRLQGFLTFSTVVERTWEEPTLTLLGLVAELISSVIERHRTEVALRQSQKRLQLAQMAGRSIVWEWEVATDRMQLSPFAMELFGASAEQMPSTSEGLMRFIPGEDREAIAEGLRRALSEGAPYVLEHRIVTPSGETRWLAVRGQVVRGESGPSVVGVSSDITEHKQAEEALAREQERAHITLASIGDGVIRTDADDRIDYLNPVAEELTGWTLTEARGRDLHEVYQVAEEGRDHARHDPVARALATHQVVVRSGHHVMRSRDGREYAIRDSAAPILGRDGEVLGVVVAFQDVTQLRGLEREMSYLARHDPLTGLVNRREFERRLQAALAAARQGVGEHVLCYLDLDEFKLVNDTCGHVAGDQMLRQVTAILGSQLRELDLLARLGGDEFGVLLYDCSPDSGKVVAEKLCATVRQFRFRWEDRMFDVGASIGVVPIDAASGPLHQVLSAADAACYVAKEQGRNRVHVYEPDDHALAKRYGEMQWVQRISHAFETDGFRLFRQPIVRLQGGGEPMAEILLRMRDPEGGYFSTASFIAAAERYHLMDRIDRWVVDRALAVAAASGTPEILTINLSGQSLGDAAFLEFTTARLARAGVRPERICFEVTETAAITHLGRARVFLAGVKELGCRVVLDDFGTGLSSFAYLKTLPVDFLKIDGEFIRHLVDDPVQRALVESIHQIGRVMGLETIAEAVESAEALRLLAGMGVDFAQGFHLGRPEPLEAEAGDG